MMTIPEFRTPPPDPEAPSGHGSPGHRNRRGHGWMMIVCCIPMLAIAVALVATGVASPSFILVALACTAMMAMMMGGMHGGGGSDGAAGSGGRDRNRH
jgi:hypothetical protein